METEQSWVARRLTNNRIVKCFQRCKAEGRTSKEVVETCPPYARGESSPPGRRPSIGGSIAASIAAAAVAAALKRKKRCPKKETIASFAAWSEEVQTLPDRRSRRFFLDAWFDRAAERLPRLNKLRALNGTMPAAARWINGQGPVLALIDSLLRGVAQVVLANNPVSGGFILASFFAAGSRHGDVRCT